MKTKVLIPPKALKSGTTRALLLFSGGLDSLLAGLILEKQGFDILPIVFTSPFFGNEKALKGAKNLGWPLVSVDMTTEIIKIIERPKHGYGKNLNPCIDCHALMIRLAGRFMKRFGASFIATGEVLGGRPKSQSLRALATVEEESGLMGYILRPLSAKLLSPTVPEKENSVKREALLDISGRSRKKQYEVAKSLGLKSFPTPGGGCLLTDQGFSTRLKKLFSRRGRLLAQDIALLKHGRHFFFGDDWIAIGRNEQENKEIERVVKKGDFVILTLGKPGPVTVVRSFGQRPADATIEEASILTIRYSQSRNDPSASVSITEVGGCEKKEIREFEHVKWAPLLEKEAAPF